MESIVSFTIARPLVYPPLEVLYTGKTPDTSTDYILGRHHGNSVGGKRSPFIFLDDPKNV
jgi:hypothetical protein